MATSRQRRKSSSSNSKGGGAMFGVLVGLIIGLAAAAGVAYFVTQVPMPFVDKASRSPAQTLLPDVRDAPDPNTGLYGHNGAAGQQAQGPIDTAPAAPPETSQPGQVSGPSGHQDDIGALLATLGSAAQSGKPAAPEKSPDPAPTQTPAQPQQPQAQKPTPAPAAKPVAPAPTSTTYYLQAGAFRSETDAQSVRGRILMMGLPVQVQSAQVNGSQLYRVRVGPFRGIDEMNRSRVQLSEAKIESTVVRP